MVYNFSLVQLECLDGKHKPLLTSVFFQRNALVVWNGRMVIHHALLHSKATRLFISSHNFSLFYFQCITWFSTSATFNYRHKTQIWRCEKWYYECDCFGDAALCHLPLDYGVRVAALTHIELKSYSLSPAVPWLLCTGHQSFVGVMCRMREKSDGEWPSFSGRWFGHDFLW